MAGYPKALSQRLGEKVLAKRRPLEPAELSDVEMLEVITGAHAAAATLIGTYGSLAALAEYGSENSFAGLYGQPGISASVIAKLEVWLESIGRTLGSPPAGLVGAESEGEA